MVRGRGKICEIVSGGPSNNHQENYLLQTRMQKMPYKHIAAHLKKTELACRLHYHQLSHGGCAALADSSPWTSQCRRCTGHASARAATSRPQTQVHARRRPASCRPEREEELDLEANRRLLSGPQLWYPAGAILHEA